ncbi:MAG: S8 family serine peptidase [Truepera sp.]|nr:S8 family serine peptidase [Truepera sp.]
MAATLTQTKPAWIARQPRWLLASLAAAACATVLAGCGAPTTQSAGPPTTPPAGPVGSPPTTHSLPTLPRCSGGGVSTADHGCISATEFVARRNHIAQQHLADPEYQRQKALERINAHQAHASLEVVSGSGTKPGEGVTIGIIDSGVDLNHPELAGAQLEENLLQGVPDETMNDPRGFSHGTAVTSVIAAQPNGKDFIGLAWGADFKVFAAPVAVGNYPGGYDPTTYDWVEVYKTVLASGVDIVNASYSFGGTFIENYTAEQIRNSPLVLGLP